MKVKQKFYGICGGCGQEFPLYGWEWQWKIPPHDAHGAHVKSEVECIAKADVQRIFATTPADQKGKEETCQTN